MTRRVSIFGSTGSIGCNTVELVAREPDRFDVVALSGGRNVKKLAEQALKLRCEVAVTAYDDCYTELKTALAGSGITVAAGAAAVSEAACRPVDWVMSAIVGSAGLSPGLTAAAQGATLALANKESLVTAGPLLMETARQAGARVLPVDSEHSAIFQALIGEDVRTVERIIITASGGAFRDWPQDALAGATLAEASSHPNWTMGQRITIDSASLFNKAMELIETKEYFGIDPARIETVIHPESLVHALVGFVDGALMAHVGPPDMRHAIGFALNWPERRELPVDRLDLAAIGQLNFRAPDEVRYPALRLARTVMKEGGLYGAAFTAAKEIALDGFIDGRIGFLEMATVVEDVLEKMAQDCQMNAAITLDTVMETDHFARVRANETIGVRA
jgi:1-deoxy-D-xylulose-5-phosphate reductoisomerase